MFLRRVIPFAIFPAVQLKIYWKKIKIGDFLKITVELSSVGIVS
jgi:hypothetical protein